MFSLANGYLIPAIDGIKPHTTRVAWCRLSGISRWGWETL